MKLGPLIKLDKRNTPTSKKKKKMKMTSFWKIALSLPFLKFTTSFQHMEAGFRMHGQ